MNWQAIRDHMRDTLDIDGRVYMRRAPQNVDKPYVVMMKVSDPRGQMGTRRPRYQFSVFDTIYGRGRDLSDEIKDEVKKMDGAADIFAPYNEDDRELYEEDTKLFHFVLDAIFYFDTGETW